MKHRHHIIPRHEWKRRFGNLKGFNAPDNVVWLTLEQHIQVHWLLWELNRSEFDRIAALGLSGRIGKEEAIRLAGIHANKGRKRGPQSLADRHKKSIAGMGHEVSQERREKQRLKMIGRKTTPEQRQKQRKAQLGLKRSFEHCQRQSLRQQGVPQPTIICPHCMKFGGISNMKRWHFNNCKKR